MLTAAPYCNWLKGLRKIVKLKSYFQPLLKNTKLSLHFFITFNILWLLRNISLVCENLLPLQWLLLQLAKFQKIFEIASNLWKINLVCQIFVAYYKFANSSFVDFVEYGMILQIVSEIKPHVVLQRHFKTWEKSCFSWGQARSENFPVALVACFCLQLVWLRPLKLSLDRM